MENLNTQLEQNGNRLIIWYTKTTDENKGHSKNLTINFPDMIIIAQEQDLIEKIKNEKEKRILLIVCGSKGRELNNLKEGRSNNDLNLLLSPNIHKVYVFCSDVKWQYSWIPNIKDKDKLFFVSNKYTEIEDKLKQDSIDLIPKVQNQQTEKKDRLIVWYFIDRTNNIGYFDEMKAKFPDEEFDFIDNNELLEKKVQREKKRNIFLVTSGTHGRELNAKKDVKYSSLLLSSNIHKIYIFCSEIEYQKDWTSDIEKISLVANKYKEIETKMGTDLKEYNQQIGQIGQIVQKQVENVISIANVVNVANVVNANPQDSASTHLEKSEAEKYLKECDDKDFHTNMIEGPLSSTHGFMPRQNPINHFKDGKLNGIMEEIIKNLPEWWENNKIVEEIDKLKLNNIEYDKKIEAPLLVLILGNVAHAYYHNQNDKNSNENDDKKRRKLPNDDFMNLWEECSKILKRQQELHLIDNDNSLKTTTKEIVPFSYLSYNDIIHCNIRIKNKEEGAKYTFEEVQNIDNFELLITTIDKKDKVKNLSCEKNFYKAQVDIGFKSAPLVKLVAECQSLIITNEKLDKNLPSYEENIINNEKNLISKISSMIDYLKKVIEAYKNIIPSEFEENTRVDPIEWARGIGKLASVVREEVKIDNKRYGRVQGPNGFGSPFTHVLDIFLGRADRYISNFGKEGLTYRVSFPPMWKTFLEKLAKINVAKYINESKNEDLKSIYWELSEMHVGVKGWLETHMLKLYTYLEAAFKTGRDVTIGGLRGFIKERNWRIDGKELSETNKERVPKDNYFNNLIRVKKIEKEEEHTIIEFDRPDNRFHYTAGDCVAILPENSQEEVEKILRILGSDGKDKINYQKFTESAKVWEEHLKYRFDKTNYKNYELKDITLGDVIKFGRIRNVTPKQAKILTALVPNDYLRKYSEDTVYLAKLELKHILTKCKSLIGTDPSFKERILDPGPEFLVQLYSGILDLIQPEEFRYYSIASSPNYLESKNILRIIVAKLKYKTDDEIQEIIYKNNIVLEDTNLQKGSSSNYISNLKENDMVSIKIIHNPFVRLPEVEKKGDNNISRPIIMIGAGVGISPFLSFLEERKQLNINNNYLYYSARTFDDCHFLKNLIGFYKEKSNTQEKFLNLEICLTGEEYSQKDDVKGKGKNQEIIKEKLSDEEYHEIFQFTGTTKNKYKVKEKFKINHFIRGNNNLSELIENKDINKQAFVYVCGRNEFANSVKNEILELLKSVRSGCDKNKEAQERMNKLITCKMLCIDAFSSFKDLKYKKYEKGINLGNNHNTDEKEMKISEVVKEEQKCYVIIDDYVYDLTDFKDHHHGGATIIELYKGMDATDTFSFIKHSKSAQIVSNASLYIVAKVKKPKIVITLKNLYNSWVEYLFTLVELRNAWDKDISYYSKDTNFHQIASFKKNEMIKSHSRFLELHLETIFSEKLFSLWSDIFKLINENRNIKAEQITEFGEEELRKRFGEIEKERIDDDEIIDAIRKTNLYPKFLYFERKLCRDFLINIVKIVNEGLKEMEELDLEKYKKGNEKGEINNSFKNCHPFLLSKLYELLNKLQSFKYVIFKFWKQHEKIKEINFFYNKVEDNNYPEEESYCKGLKFPMSLAPAVIYTKKIENLQNSIKFYSEIDENGIESYTYSIIDDFFPYSLEKFYYDRHKANKNDTLKKQLKFEKNKHEKCCVISDGFRKDFELMIPNNAKSYIWAYQFETIQKNSLAHIYETFTDMFKEDSEEAQKIRFALFGAFIFFEDEDGLKHQKIVGITTLNFPAKYENKEFTGLLLSDPITKVGKITEKSSNMLDVTIPYLKLNGAKKYQVSNILEKHRKTFEFIYEIEKGLSIKTVKFEALKVRKFILVNEECLIENKGQKEEEYKIFY